MSAYSGHSHGGYNECKSGHDRWRVVDRNCNHSAFNGYRKTYSAYSCVRCLDCGVYWRTKAAYVDGLLSATDAESIA
jgi:hypothetical protein